MPRSERLVKLLKLLHTTAGLEADALARACGISERTLLRDLDSLTAAGFPVYFDHGYRLAVPSLLPAITLTADEALALCLAAQAADRRPESSVSQALAIAAQKLQQALATKRPDAPTERQLALALPVQDPRTEALLRTLTVAIAERRSVRLSYLPAARRGARWRGADPYRLLPSPRGWILLAYCHDRQRILPIPVAHVREAAVMRRRYDPVPARLLERHLHRRPGGSPSLQWVRVACRPPLVQNLRKHPPVGALMWEEGPAGSLIFTIATLRQEDLVPWLLACGDAVEVLEPSPLS